MNLGEQLRQAADLARLEEIAAERARLLEQLDKLNTERGLLIRALRAEGVTVLQLSKRARINRQGVYEALAGKHRTPTGAGRRPKGA